MAKTKTKKNRKFKKPKSWQACNWRELVRGDIVKSIASNGPYLTNPDGTVEFMGHYGIFKVYSIDDKGVHCYDTDLGGHCYISMVDGVGLIGIVKKPHKLLKKVVVLEKEPTK